MTTIAYKDGVIAYDSQVTAGETIQTKRFNKCFTKDGVKFIVTGTLSDREALLEAYFTGETGIDDIECSALILEKDGSLRVVCVDNGKVYRDELKESDYFAAGSGEGFAYGAMDMGASAKEAVKVASNRDLYTGGRIRTIKVEK